MRQGEREIGGKRNRGVDKERPERDRDTVRERERERDGERASHTATPT